MKDLSKWLNPRAAIGSLLSVVALLSVAGGIVSCTPGGEGVKEANEDVEDRNDNQADDEADDDKHGNEAPNSNNQDDDD